MLLCLKEHHLVISHGKLLPLKKDTLKKLTDKSTAAVLCESPWVDNGHASLLFCSSEYFFIINIVCRNSFSSTIMLTAGTTA